MTKLAPGTVVKIRDLKSQTQYNGTFGIVSRFVEDQGRYEVRKGRGSGSTLGIKPDNLSCDGLINPFDEAFERDRSWEQLAFWPSLSSGEIPVQPLAGWPTSESGEDEFLKQTLHYSNPKILSGITSEGNAKPNFQCYFDAEDKTSPINETAEAMASLLPMYELSKISGNYRPIRGPCVLIYSPMKSTFFSSAGGAKTTSMSDDPGRRFSAKELREVLLFHHTKRAKAMYASHDNPMHRMFGGMM